MSDPARKWLNHRRLLAEGKDLTYFRGEWTVDPAPAGTPGTVWYLTAEELERIIGNPFGDC